MNRERTAGATLAPLVLLAAVAGATLLVPPASAQESCSTVLANDGRATDGAQAPGEGLAVAIGRQSEDLGSALDDRQFDVRFANATSDRERARVVADEVERIATRLRVLERCTGTDPFAGSDRTGGDGEGAPAGVTRTGQYYRPAWQAESWWQNASWWRNGSVGEGGSDAPVSQRGPPTDRDPSALAPRERALVRNETRALERRLNDTRVAATDLPPSLRERRDVGADSFRALAWRIRHLRGATPPSAAVTAER